MLYKKLVEFITHVESPNLFLHLCFSWKHLYPAIHHYALPSSAHGLAAGCVKIHCVTLWQFKQVSQILIQFESRFFKAGKLPAQMPERAGLKLTAVLVYLLLQSLFSSPFCVSYFQWIVTCMWLCHFSPLPIPFCIVQLWEPVWARSFLQVETNIFLCFCAFSMFIHELQSKYMVSCLFLRKASHLTFSV